VTNANRAWLYARLSRDDDAELNSLTNQQNIIREYADKNGFTVIGESSDDNISGMHFNREGIERITEAVDARLIDAVIVKDLSRLGRHRTQTAMFIDFLRENNVKVISVTENIDTSNEDDDLMVGFKGIFNDMYAKDISRKVRAGFYQKQKEGLVMIPPMGYYKDKNTGEIIIMEEPAAIIRKIFKMYLDGYGLKAIAYKLNEEGLKTPSYYQWKYLNKKQGYNKPEITYRFLWNGTAVKRVLVNEFYCGNLVNHKYMLSKIYHQRKQYSPEEHIRHEGAVPAIISKDAFDKVQQLIESKKRDNVRAGHQRPYHRYTGLLECADCGCSFSCKIRRCKDTPDRHEYVCNSYHRYGVDNCTSHRINEDTLDAIVYDELMNIRQVAKDNFARIDIEFNKWKSQKSNSINMLTALEEKLHQRKKDQEDILLERIRDKEHADIYTNMLKKCEADITAIQEKISDMKNIEKTVKNRKADIQSSIEVFDRIASEGIISDTDLRLLIEKIIIGEDKDGKLNVEVRINGNFRRHIDIYQDGELSERFMEAWWQDA
jgi:DNA invertase Pin-like site-specific DNA recombinase